MTSEAPHKSGLRTTRRSALALLGLGGVAACSPQMESMSAGTRVSEGAFAHGVASGDPTSTSIILWTRISQDSSDAQGVSWEIDTDPEFSAPKTGEVMTRRAADFTIKIDVKGLQPGTVYYYRFETGGVTSPVGRTKTLAEGPLDTARFAVASCSNYEHGYFNVYDLIAQRQASGTADYDALIHLGDYYYEYAADAYDAPDKPAGRVHEPSHEILNLDDYRRRHAQYRRDPNLQAVTALMPLIAIWDDHETSNDSWRDGAQNHDETEGEWAARKEAALRAYYEWMPVRDPEPGRAKDMLYRSFQFGDLLTLVGVETRLTARAEPLIFEEYVDEISQDPDAFRETYLNDPSREMFGGEQRRFIVDTFVQSRADGVQWRMMANQVILGRLMAPDFTPYVTEEAVTAIEKDWPGIHDFLSLSQYNLPFYPDSWDGYPHARERFYEALEKDGVHDLLVVTGDAHEFWAIDLTRDTGTPMGAEFVTSSVSSKTLKAYLGDATKQHNLLLTRENEDARYYNALHNGFMDVELRRKQGTITFHAVTQVNDRNYETFEAASFSVSPQTKDGKDTLRIGRPKGLSLTQRALFMGLG